MHILEVLLISSIFIAQGTCLNGLNEVYNIVHQASFNAEIGRECRTSLELYVRNLDNGTDDDQWALQMLDATSRIPVGLLSYNLGEMGNFEQCLATKSNHDYINGKYCLGYISSKTSNSSELRNLTGIDEEDYFKRLFQKITPEMYLIGKPTWAICLPSNCSDAEISALLSHNKEIHFKLSKLTCQNEEDVHQPLNKEAIVAICVLSIIIYLMFVSTLYDVSSRRNNKPTIPILVVFSVYSNGKGLFETRSNSNPLECLNGIRTFSMMWIILMHIFSIAGSEPLFNAKGLIKFKDTWVSLFAYGGEVACDTFLFISGILISYNFFKHKTYEKKFNVFEYYLHRYLRLAPVLAGAVLISATLLRYMGSGPKWNIFVENFEVNCKKNWWSAMLFIQNYASTTKMCVGHSWYLNIDMQLYILSPLFLFLLWKNYKAGVSLIVSLCLLSIFCGFYLAYSEELSGVPTNFFTRGSRRLYMNDFYLKTHTRAAPWLLGLILGYILIQKKPQKNNNKVIIMILWLICLLVVPIIVFGAYPTLRGKDYDVLGNASFIAFSRPAWTLCVGWMVWACANEFGGIINTILSLPIFQVFNKFSYSMYIIHVTFLYMMAYGRKTAIYFGVFDLIFRFFATLSFVFCMSVISVLTFELPILKLEKIMLKK